MTPVSRTDTSSDPLVNAIHNLRPLLDRPEEMLKADWPEDIAGYQVLDEIAWSGQAVTLLAYDRRLKRRVVLKLYSSGGPTAATTGVLEEGKRLANVDSPFVARCLAADTYQGAPFLVLEYIEGTDLRDYSLTDKEQIAQIVSGIAEGLSHLHEQGLAHGDLKPSNIIIEPSGRPRLIDLGSASRAAVGAVSSTGPRTSLRRNALAGSLTLIPAEPTSSPSAQSCTGC